MASLKVAVTVELVATPVALSAGVVEVTLGTVVGQLLPLQVPVLPPPPQPAIASIAAVRMKTYLEHSTERRTGPPTERITGNTPSRKNR
jgi:hypothetical protein